MWKVIKFRQLHALMQLVSAPFIYLEICKRVFLQELEHVQESTTMRRALLLIDLSCEDNFKKEICFQVKLVLVRLLVGIKQIT